MDKLDLEKADMSALSATVDYLYSYMKTISEYNDYFDDHLRELFEVIEEDHSAERYLNIIQVARDLQETLSLLDNENSEVLKINLELFELACLRCFEEYEQEAELYLTTLIPSKAAKFQYKATKKLIGALEEFVDEYDYECVKIISLLIYINNYVKDFFLTEEHSEIMKNIYLAKKILTSNGKCNREFANCCLDIIRFEEAFIYSWTHDYGPIPERVEIEKALKESVTSCDDFYKNLEDLRNSI